MTVRTQFYHSRSTTPLLRSWRSEARFVWIACPGNYVPKIFRMKKGCTSPRPSSFARKDFPCTLRFFAELLLFLRGAFGSLARLGKPWAFGFHSIELFHALDASAWRVFSLPSALCVEGLFYALGALAWRDFDLPSALCAEGLFQFRKNKN